MGVFSLLITVCTYTHLVLGYYADKPCLKRYIPNQSVVCVCNMTYCDEITRYEIPAGKCVAYTSSREGLRFRKALYHLNPFRLEDDLTCSTTLELDPSKKFQAVEGFGGGITDAAGINWLSLKDESLKQKLIDSYFGPNGIEYNMARVPIGGCDFSTHRYAYNEYPEGDADLSNFSLTYEDYYYKIPMIREASKVATAPINIVGTTWSPPLWMKTNDEFGGTSRLKREFYQTYADYHRKFIEAYAEENIPMWAVTTTNEPINGVVSLVKFNSLGWNVTGMGEYIAQNLGPTLRKHASHVKILAVDDQRFLIPLWFNYVVKYNKDALEYIDGIAVHFYADLITPPSTLKTTTEEYPDVFVISTEGCAGIMHNPSVDLGSWPRAERYILDILEDLRNSVVGWIDWNLCLNENGGPNWVENYVDSPIIVYPDKGEFVKQPMFYAMGHFSKFLPRGSRRIQVNDLCSKTIENVAFLTPRNTIVVVLYNGKDNYDVVTLKLGNQQAKILMEPESITTVEFQYDV